MGVDEVFDGFDAGTSVDNTTDEDDITEGVGADSDETSTDEEVPGIGMGPMLGNKDSGEASKDEEVPGVGMGPTVGNGDNDETSTDEEVPGIGMGPTVDEEEPGPGSKIGVGKGKMGIRGSAIVRDPQKPNRVANGEGRGMRMRGTDAHLSSLMREMCAAMIDRDHVGYGCHLLCLRYSKEKFVA
ncbi:hypothetical protein CERSUDRAFT_75663 [Gelatoporia subvermispora B]|uniref:Uncharacterized protein n=1 Tax=Ceriporiopsis subvermispora (strain B) TaxID=914234 RepID=M2QCJ4_CERS8|nr:hypothetical protein CERSUDRAFT_75663 [Gelatoporia subvermispora B]